MSLKESFDLIYSIGEDCACATYMKRNKLRSTSGPFDWLTHADFETRIKLVTTDFNHFLDFEDLKFLEKDEKMFNDADCDYYENVRTGFYFFHNFPQGIALEKSYPEVYRQFDRRCKRFTRLLQKAKKPLLIWFSQYQKLSDSQVLEAAQRLCKKFGKEIHLAVIEHDGNLPRGEITSERPVPNVARYYLNSIVLDDKGLPTTFGDDKTCGQIFSKYKLKLPLKTKIKNSLFKTLIKTACAVIPNKKIQKKLKGLIK